ncbi:unnamed protein product, partial [marine sediment metagenome]
ISYWDKFHITFGAEFFGGPDNTLLGLFSDNDQLYVIVDLDF